MGETVLLWCVCVYCVVVLVHVLRRRRARKIARAERLRALLLDGVLKPFPEERYEVRLRSRKHR